MLILLVVASATRSCAKKGKHLVANIVPASCQTTPPLTQRDMHIVCICILMQHTHTHLNVTASGVECGSIHLIYH